MRSSSYFQSLPEFIVKRILAYLLSSRNTGLSLLHSCSLWRFWYSKYALGNLEISLQHKPFIGVQYPEWPENVALPSYPTNQIVKKVKLNYHGWVAAHKNNDVDLLKLSFPDELKFLSANVLDLTITLDRNYETNDTLDKLDKILFHVWRLVPNIQSIGIDCKLTDFFYTEKYSWFFATKVFSKIKGIRNVSIANFESSSLDTSGAMSDLVGLTSFKYNQFDYSDMYHQVVRRNASTLRVLFAEYERHRNMHDVFFDGATPMIYPNLESLGIIFYKEETANIPNQYNHFPCLKRLHLLAHNEDYPEALFNNSNATLDSLEYLELHGDSGFYKRAVNYSAFASKRISKLKTAVVHVTKGYVYNDEDVDNSAIEFTDLLIDSSKELSRLKIDGSIDKTYFLKKVATSVKFANLQEIKVPDIELCFSDILLLMKAAPLLSLLDSSLSNICPSIINVESCDILQYMETNCVDFGNHMKEFVFGCVERQGDLKNFCLSVTLLASICPKIVYIFTRSFDIEDVKNQILQIFKTREFSTYSYCCESLSNKIAKPGCGSIFGF